MLQSSQCPLTRAPAPRSLPLVGDAPRLLFDPLGAFLAGWRDCGDVVRFRVAPRRAYLVVHPSAARRVLFERRAIYGRDRWHTTELQRVSGHGLTASEGGLWAQQRSLLRPLFHGDQAPAQARAAAKVTARMLERWSAVEHRGGTLDLHDEMLRLSLEIICEAMFSVNLGRESSAITQSAAVVLDGLYRRMRVPLPALARPRWWGEANFNASRDSLYRFADRLLRTSSQGLGGGDMLTVLGRYADRQLALDQIVTVILAGHDTTGSALTWAGHLIASHPRVDCRLYAEVADKAQSGLAGPIRSAYARHVFREALRLYPPAWAISRSPCASETLDGYTIEAGATVFLSPFLTHRHPAFWSEPERFIPERFEGDGAASHAYAYLPFGAGPRMCIGRILAETIGEVVIATIARSYSLLPAVPAAIVPRARLTLHPAAATRVYLQPRASVACPTGYERGPK